MPNKRFALSALIFAALGHFLSKPRLVFSRKFQIVVFFTLIFSSLAPAQAQQPGQFWQAAGQIAKNRPAKDAWVQPEKSHAFNVDHATLRSALAKAPKEFSREARTAPGEIRLPMPDGTSARFRIVESPIMAPKLAAKFPEIKTYLGQGIDDPAASVRFDVTPEGLHAQVLSPKGAVYIDPFWRGDRVLHTSYYKRDYRKAVDDFQCLVPAANAQGKGVPAQQDLFRSGSNLRTYRLACAATGEYTQFQGGTVAAGMSAIVTAINRVTGIYEVELAMRLVLVGNNNLIVYTSASSDPYSNTSPSSLLTQNQSNLDSVIGNANYDIGHVFSTGGGGLAAVDAVCVTGSKARGETGSSSPTGDTFYIDFVVHEMGHQFGALHTFNSVIGSCSGGNREAGTAYEPGAGTTIMAYAGLCGADNTQPHSDAYFHFISFDEIIAYSTAGAGNDCAVLTATGNNAPTVNAGANYTIPKNTPFILTASGSDPDGDALTYCWEEGDLGPAQALSNPDNGSSPLFRSFNPSSSPSRTFPKLSALLSNTASLGEKLPATNRVMSFRVTARDNRAGGGGVNTSNMQVTVNASAGPFVITAPNTGVSWSGGQTVTWNVAGTAAAPINAANVNILLSTNGGTTFNILLATNTSNDGSEQVLLPNISTSLARIKVEAAGNIFFDISDVNFSITPSSAVPFASLISATVASESCGAGNTFIDPNETVSLNIELKNIGSANTTNLVATLLSTNGVVCPSGAQVYGALIAGGATVTRPFSFTASGMCGGIIRMVLRLQDGVADLGTVDTQFALGGITMASTAFTNSGNISIPLRGVASPYPSSIAVAGLSGTITKATVSLVNLNHTFPNDLDILLVAPNNQTVFLMGQAGGSNALNNVNLTFDSFASTGLPDASPILSGTYVPSNYGAGSSLPAPAPGAPYGSALSSLNGMNPNGTWSLYVYDSADGDEGSISGGWALTLNTVATNCCTGNNRPAISSISNQVTDEDTPTGAIFFTVRDNETPATSLVVTGASSHTNLVPNANLIFSGTSTNRSVTVVPVTNQFGNSTITISVSDGITKATSSFLLTVNPVNDAPLLTAISNRIVYAGSSVAFSNSASDVDLPADILQFSFDLSASGAQLNPTNGIFSWLPAAEQAGTNNFTIRVTDNGTPPLGDAKTFFIIVISPPKIQSVTQANGQVTLTWDAIAGRSYRVQYKDDLNQSAWTDLTGDIIAVSSSAAKTDSSGMVAQRFYRILALP